jgi:hydrogenase small subunit
MSNKTIGEQLATQGISRRAFLKQCLIWSTSLALPTTAAPLFAERLPMQPRKPVIWLSFQECTGCTESLSRSHYPTLEDLLFNLISLDYHHTLQAAAGKAAENAKERTATEYRGRYLLVVEGSVPLADYGYYSACRGKSSLVELQECAATAEAIVAIGSCATYGGIPQAAPNPTGAVGVHTLMESGYIADKPLVNIPGCPPIPVVMGAVLAHYLVFEDLPYLDDLRRPRAFYGDTIHDRCPRLHYYEQGKFARSFDDEGARNGWCLYELGCKGPTTHNACATLKWNEGTSFPIQSGHPCLGCSEPNFWDRGGFYRPVAQATPPASAATQVPDEAVFDSHCGGCHTGGPESLQTVPSGIPPMLRSDKSPAHRALQLPEEQLQRLVEYLESLSK